MKYRKDIREVVLRMLSTKLDIRLSRHGFKRNSRSLEYRRTIGDTNQAILSSFESHPSSDPSADAYIYPWTFIALPTVYECAIKMVGDPKLLQNNREKMLSQPTDWAAPKDYKPRWWYLTGEEQIMNAGDSIGDYIQQWVLPLLNDVSSIQGFVQAFETNDKRIAVYDSTVIYFAAAYLLLGKPETAMQTLKQKIRRPDLISKYSKAFEFVQHHLHSRR